MENNKILIKGSFRGISADLVKNLLILIINFIVYALCKYFQQYLYSKYDISTFWNYITDYGKISVIAMLGTIYLAYMILIIISISCVFKILSLFYKIGSSTLVDYENHRIVTTTYSFPFIKNVDENKINEIINVNITQGFFNKVFDTGHVYIEYLTYSTVDSQLRTSEMPFIAHPFNIKNKVM